MRITAFKIPKPKRFEYIPRYYDAQKEMREERNRRIFRELENEEKSGEGSYKPMEKGDARHYFSYSSNKSYKRHRGTILIRVVTLILALTVALLVFYGTWILVRLV